MFHKVKSVKPLGDFLLQVRFVEGVTKVYDIKPLFNVWEVLHSFKEDPCLFEKVEVVPDGYGIVWNDEIDLFCEDLFEFGKTI